METRVTGALWDVRVQLERLHDELAAAGQPAVADHVRAAIEHLPGDGDDAAASAPIALISTGEAAQLLSVRSVNTIKRWAREGLLEGFQRGGRVLVSRRSVERLLTSPPLAQQRAVEQRLSADLSGFGADEPPDEPLDAAWQGRKLWEQPTPAPPARV